MILDFFLEDFLVTKMYTGTYFFFIYSSKKKERNKDRNHQIRPVAKRNL